jgi:hypothetical protein
MARYHLARTTPVRLRDLSAPSTVLSREQWAIAGAIDGTRSVQDLAWQCGLALYEAIEYVDGLIQAGVCDPGTGPPPAEPTGNPRIRAQVRAADTEPPRGGDFMPAQPELLRRVLDGLRKL